MGTAWVNGPALWLTRPTASPRPLTCSTVKADDAEPAQGGPVSPETTMPSSGTATCSIARNGVARFLALRSYPQASPFAFAWQGLMIAARRSISPATSSTWPMGTA